MTIEHRRGACPEVLHPMETGDGLLARLPAQEGGYSLEALLGLCAASRTHGNGFIEVTRRGNVQVRGLRPDSVSELANALIALGVMIESGPAIQSNPLAGHDASQIMDPRPIASVLRRRLATAHWRSGLAPKLSFAIDGGGALHLDGIDADLRLRAAAGPRGATLHVIVGGDAGRACELGTVAPRDGAEALLRLAAAIAKRGPRTRARDVVESEGRETFAAELGDLIAFEDRAPGRPAAEPVGTHALRDGRVAVGLGLAFGQSDAGAIEDLIHAAMRAGASSIAPAERHALLAIGVDRAHAAELRAAAKRAGFVTRPDDARRHISACAGAPACAAAQMPTRAQACAVARAAAPLLDGSVRIHLSGCAKGCAHPGPTALTFVGADDGCGFVFSGNARSAPLARLEGSLEACVESLSRRVLSIRERDERITDVLMRMGASELADAMLERSVR